MAEARPDREELKITVEKQQQRLLQAYLDGISELGKGGQSQEEVSIKVREQTMSVLSKLDAVRKGLMLRSLCRLGLIDKIDWKDADLSGANLSGADLSAAKLYGANFSGANFSGANLRDTLQSHFFREMLS